MEEEVDGVIKVGGSKVGRLGNMRESNRLDD